MPKHLHSLFQQDEALQFFLPLSSHFDSQVDIEFSGIFHPPVFMVILEGGSDIGVSGHLLDLQNVVPLAALYRQGYGGVLQRIRADPSILEAASNQVPRYYLAYCPSGQRPHWAFDRRKKGLI